MKLLIFYHCLFQIGNHVLEAATPIVKEQMAELKRCGLLDAASEMHVGINGGEDAKPLAESLFPSHARVTYHGMTCRNELRTLLMLEDWLASTNDEAYILWCHSKGATHRIGSKTLFNREWRQCMTSNLVTNWRQCVQDLEVVESVGCHWMQPPSTPKGQYIWAGNFWWARASFLRTLPSLMARKRIQISGVDALESRYEAEVWIGNGQRRPVVRDYCNNWNPGKKHIGIL